MKKKLLVLLLCTALLLPLLSAPATADEKLAFFSINDTLPPELIGCAVNYGGTMYVPYYVFTNYGFGIGYSYLTNEATAYLYSGERKLIFELDSGKTTDGDGTAYTAPGIVRSGTVYVPLGFTARFFGGISISSIVGNEYGSILRLTDGSEVLTDTEFLRAAKSVMRIYAHGMETPAPEPTPTELPTDPPMEDIHAGEQIDLSFIGLPAEAILDRLAQNRATACFFLTAEEVQSAPDTVRRLVCEGHSVGVLCMEDLAAEYAATAELLFGAARVCTELVTAEAAYAADCRSAAEAAGLVYCDFDYDAAQEGVYAVTAHLEIGNVGGALLLSGSADATASLGVLLAYLRTGKFSVGAPRELG